MLLTNQLIQRLFKAKMKRKKKKTSKTLFDPCLLSGTEKCLLFIIQPGAFFYLIHWQLFENQGQFVQRALSGTSQFSTLQGFKTEFSFYLSFS